MTQPTAPLRRVGVVGAGMIGLSTAWHLRRAGLEVEVIDRGMPGAGASWGNAGWVTPDLAEPLASPAMLKQGLQAMLTPRSPVAVRTASREAVHFMARFTRNSTHRRFDEALSRLQLLNHEALQAFDEMAAAGVTGTVDAPIVAAFSSDQARNAFLESHAGPTHVGVSVMSAVSRSEAIALEPALGPAVAAGARIDGQRYLDPDIFIKRLVQRLTDERVSVLSGVEVGQLRSTIRGVALLDPTETVIRTYDAVVVASGASMSRLVAKHGVRLPIVAGRGYSLTARDGDLPRLPVYVPEQRLACTPMHDGYRLVGVMEIGRDDAPMRQGRVRSLTRAAAPYFKDLRGQDHGWVGSRPLTPDGVPVIGRTRTPGVFVAGGHGMWGITLGPATGRLAASIVMGRADANMVRAFDPLRAA